MSQSAMIAVMVLLLVPLWVRMRKDFVSGLSYAIVVVVAATPLIRIQTPGLLPEITLHRAILMSLLFGWMMRPPAIPTRDAPLRRRIVFWIVVATISLVGTSDLSISIKRYLDYVLDIFAFYLIVATSLRGRDDAIRLLKSACLGLAIVAVLAVLEKYTRINVVDRFVSPDPEAMMTRDVRSTYRHRILLGTGMAMGLPLALAVVRNATSRFVRMGAWITAAAMISSCYFAQSRGPWLACGLGVFTIFIMGSGALRKPIIIFALLAALTLLARPGVLGTLSGFASSTKDPDSLKGGTYRYRLELWRVAAHGVSQSPWSFLFGCGPGSGANQSLSWTLSYRGSDFEITSWDNDLAYSLYQYGWIGLLATLALYGSIPLSFLTKLRHYEPVHRDTLVCIGASTLALLFMMSNVMIFARQLHYLLWTTTAIGFTLLRAYQSEEYAENEIAGAWADDLQNVEDDPLAGLLGNEPAHPRRP